MEKEPRKLGFALTPWVILLVVLPLLYLNVFMGGSIRLEQSFQYVSTRITVFTSSGRAQKKHDDDSMEFLLSSLLPGKDRMKLEQTGFACNTEIYSKHCVANRPMQIDTKTMTITVPSDQPAGEMIIRPYARQEDEVLLRRVTPVRVLTGNWNSTPPPACGYKHDIPAVVFSSSGFVGNIFHEINEIIIPLFITTRKFNSRVLLVMEDHNPSFLKKFGGILARLTSSEILKIPAKNGTVYCFPAGVIGLKFHGHLAVNSSDVPTGLSMRHFRQFLRESLDLKFSHVSQIKRPRLIFLSRRTTRRFLNEDEIVAMLRELGFDVIVVARAKVVSNLNLFASIINSCCVFVGAHGAGLTNELFLPDGAVVVQVDLIGLNWAAASYYGNPARGMGLHYLRYKIEPEESSLWKIFGQRNLTVFTDPKGAFPVTAGREVYLNGQNVRVDVARFRKTMVEAMSLVRETLL